MPNVNFVTEPHVIGAVEDGQVRASQGRTNAAVFVVALGTEGDDLLAFVAQVGRRMGQASWRAKDKLIDALKVRVTVLYEQGGAG